MLPSDVVAIDHHRVHYDDRDGMVGYSVKQSNPSKKRSSGKSSNPENMKFEFVPSMPTFVSPFQSPSSSSPSFTDGNVNGDLARPLPKRIVTMNVVRPIPKRLSKQFYDEAYREGSTLLETNQAAIIAHDWHRKWTHQDEANHTMPDEDFYRPGTAGVPISYNYNNVFDDSQGVDFDTLDDHGRDDLRLIFEREEGAKNPSLGSTPENDRTTCLSKRVDCTQIHHHSATNKRQQQQLNTGLTELQLQYFRKSTEHFNCERNAMLSSTEASTASSEESSSRDNANYRQAKRQFTGFDNSPSSFDDDLSDQDEDFDPSRNYKPHDSHFDDDQRKEPCSDHRNSIIQRPLPIRPVVVRPVAVHANRSEFVPPQPSNIRLSPFVHDSRNGKIPQDIVTNGLNGTECVSPMSHSQLTESLSMSSGSHLGSDMLGITILNTNQEGVHVVEDDCELVPNTRVQEAPIFSPVDDKIENERDDLLHTLAITDGDIECQDFKTKINPLEKHFLGQGVDTRNMPNHRQDLLSSIPGVCTTNSIDGMWLTLSKPNFFGKLGTNDNGDPMYTLGRMSFDMFSPTNLVCSLQGNFNRVEIVSGDERKSMLDAVPKKLREEVESGKTILRTYHVVTAFTIESSMAAYPTAPNKDVIRPIKGIMTTYGYSLPDPNTPNRHSIWFTGGRIEPNNDVSDVLRWKKFFTIHPPKHSFGEKAKLLAVKLLMGATIPEEINPEDGSMNYVFTRPLGGHGMAYVDVIYLDDSLRIVRGHRGTTFVFSRVPDP